MIKFQGELSLKAKAFLLKKSIIYDFIMLIIPSCFLFLLAFWLAPKMTNIIYVCAVLILILFLIDSSWLKGVEKSYFDYVFEILYTSNETRELKIALGIE